MDCANGCMPPPPSPCSTRAKISMGMFNDIPQSIDATVNNRMEIISSRLRPMRRASQPEAGSIMAFETR